MSLSCSELRRSLRTVDRGSVASLSRLHLCSSAFPSWASEESLSVCWMPTVFGGSLADFWVLALLAEGWIGTEHYFDGYVASSACRSVPSEEGRSIVTELCVDVRDHVPAHFRALEKPVEAWMMFNDWNDKAIVLRLEEAIASVRWETSA